MGKTSRDKRDIYYRLAKENKWRARSAFKLLQIDDEFQILKDVKKAVDLCAAPGSWSQVLSRRLSETTEDPKIVAIDLQPMAPIPNVIQLQGDITSVETANNVIKLFDGEKADIVICDGAPDVTGIHSLDEFMQAELILAAFNITSHVLKEGGTFLAKIFRSRNSSLLYAQLKQFFNQVYLAKPRSSRQTSCEAFVLCKEYNPPAGYIPTMARSSLDLPLNETTQAIEKFVSCGDFSGWDSEKSYPLDINPQYPREGGSEGKNNYEFQDVVQPPTDPAYKDALAFKKKGLFSFMNDKLETAILEARQRSAYNEQKLAETKEGNIGLDDKLVEGVAESLQNVEIKEDNAEKSDKPEEKAPEESVEAVEAEVPEEEAKVVPEDADKPSE